MFTFYVKNWHKGFIYFADLDCLVISKVMGAF